MLFLKKSTPSWYPLYLTTPQIGIQKTDLNKYLFFVDISILAEFLIDIAVQLFL